MIALMLKSEAQMRTIISWIHAHQKENPDEDFLSEEELKGGKHHFIKEGYLYDFNHAPTTESHKENLKDGDGFEVTDKIYVGNLTKEEQNIIENEYTRNSTSISGILTRIRDAKGHNDSSSIIATDRQSKKNYVGLDRETLQRESRLQGNTEYSQSNQGTGGISSKTGDSGEKGGRYYNATDEQIENWNRQGWTQAVSDKTLNEIGAKDRQDLADNGHAFTTPNGTVYGFVYKGVIHIDPRIATAEVPIHEYAHLWTEFFCRLLTQATKKRGISLTMIRRVGKHTLNRCHGWRKVTCLLEEDRRICL